MAIPKLLPTAMRDETFGGVTYHIEGELVPVLQVEIGSMPIYFEHHVLLWKDPSLQITIKQLAGAFKRMMSGMPIFMTQTQGAGRIAFSRDGAGHVFPIHLRANERLDVREHQFLAATDNIDYTFNRVKGVSNILLGGTGFFIDTFACLKGDGVLWLHGYGNVFEMVLNPGEQIDLEPGCWIYKDVTVKMETIFQKFSTGFLASAGQIVFNRFTGPGRIALQSMSLLVIEGAAGGLTNM
jgi:uncharacterized protein (AIM24 family)